MSLVRNQENELYLMRAVFAALREEVYALIEDNRDGDRSAMVVHSPAEKIGKNEYLVCSVIANMDRKATYPYMGIIYAKDSDVEKELKNSVADLVSKPRNSIFQKVAGDDSSAKSFRNKVIKIFGSISDDSTPAIGDCFEDIKSVSVFKILAQVVKATMDDLDDIIDNELDVDDKEKFNKSVGRYKNENISVKKDRKTFSFYNGIQLTVVGFEYDEDDNESSYSDVITDVSYSIKRETKSDDMYN